MSKPDIPPRRVAPAVVRYGLSVFSVALSLAATAAPKVRLPVPASSTRRVGTNATRKDALCRQLSDTPPPWHVEALRV